VVKGEIDLEKMRTWNQEKILATLTKIKGIGPWTVEYMMCRGMGRYEALPANDLGLRVSLTKFLGRKQRATGKEARDFLDRFGQYRGYAAFYLIYTYAFGRYPQERLL
jgi:DNA-3-methyladenine glycosylase II